MLLLLICMLPAWSAARERISPGLGWRGSFLSCGLRIVSMQWMLCVIFEDIFTQQETAFVVKCHFRHLLCVTDCDSIHLQVVGEMFDRQGYGIVLDPRFKNLSETISITLLDLQQSGYLDLLKKTWIPDTVCMPATRARVPEP